MAPVKRGWQSFFLDRAIGWWGGLPWESSSFTIERVRIPVGAEINLAADIYLSSLKEPHGTILIRTSYGLAPFIAGLVPRLFAARGYHVLHAACRGTDPSDGCELVPGIHEGPDGEATVAWMKEQPWYTGSFGTIGTSYVGYTQWAIMCNPPDDMKAAVVSTAMTDLREFLWVGSGAMDAHIIAWADLMVADRRGLNPGPAFVTAQKQNLKEVYDGVPLVEAMEKHFNSDLPDWLTRCNTDTDMEAAFYEQMDYSEALNRATLPLLQTTGWDDILVRTVARQHKVLIDKGRPANLIIGPWAHIGSGRQSLVEQFHFIEEHLGNRRPKSSNATSVRAYITGANEWRSLSKWPPTSVSTHELYLGPDKSLSSEQPTGEGHASTFTFDPKEPTPAIGQPRPFDGIAPASYEDSALAARSDVAAFTSAPLKSDVEVLGQPVLQLHHSSDNPHVDLFVRLSEVKPNGKSRRISDTYKRLDPSRGDGPITLDLLDCGHRFSKGMRLRVVIAGGAHPAKIRNLGTGENPGTGRETKKAVHTIHHSKVRLSKLCLPIGSGCRED